MINYDRGYFETGRGKKHERSGAFLLHALFVSLAQAISEAFNEV